MSEKSETILLTCSDEEFNNPIKAKYLLSYTGDQLRRAIAYNLNIKKTHEFHVLVQDAKGSTRILDPYKMIQEQQINHLQKVTIIPPLFKIPMEKPISDEIELEDVIQNFSQFIVDFKDFVVVQKIASGGFGDVLLMRSKKTGDLFAVKQIINEFSSSKEVQFYIREIALLAYFQHPCIMYLKGITDPTFGKPSIFLDYMTNGSLKTLIYNQKSKKNACMG